MKNGMGWGIVAGVSIAVLIVWATSGAPEARGQAATSPAAADQAQTLVLSLPAANGGRHVLIVDMTARVMGTYAVNPDDGRIALRSVRHYEWDLQMTDFNGSEPKPGDIRAIVEKR